MKPSGAWKDLEGLRIQVNSRIYKKIGKLQQYKMNQVLLMMNPRRRSFHLYRIFLALIKKKRIKLVTRKLTLLALRQFKKVNWVKNREKYLGHAQVPQMKVHWVLMLLIWKIPYTEKQGNVNEYQLTLMFKNFLIQPNLKKLLHKPSTINSPKLFKWFNKNYLKRSATNFPNCVRRLWTNLMIS